MIKKNVFLGFAATLVAAIGTMAGCGAGDIGGGDVNGAVNIPVVQYTLTFASRGGGAVDPVTVNAGAGVARPADPSREGFVFAGWYYDVSQYYYDGGKGGGYYGGGYYDGGGYYGGGGYEFNDDYPYGYAEVEWPFTVNKNITVYARWREAGTRIVSFVDTPNDYYLYVKEGSALEKPENPEKTYYAFDDWYDAETGGSVINWPLTVDGDMTLYARWNIIRYTVTFNTMGGSTIDAQTVDAGTYATKPANPSKSNHTFDDWYTAETGGSKFNWSTPIGSDTTVYARWLVHYTLTFNTLGGSAIDSQTVADGLNAKKPANNPVKANYIFDNWYTAETGGSVFNWSTPIKSDTTVYARWLGQGALTISFSGLPQDETTDLAGMPGETLSYITGTLAISVSAGSFPGASYQWYLDRVALAGETASGLTRQGMSFSLGQHEIMVRIMTADNKVYSKTARFTVVLP